MRKLLNAVAVAGALLGASVANAGVMITDWGYNVTTTWVTGDTVFSGGSGTQTNTPTLISWGAASGNHLTPTSDLTQNRSALGITNSNAVGSIQTNGPAAAGATITHYNNAISVDFAALRSTSLTTSLVLAQQNPVGPVVVAPPPLQFAVNFIETPNNGNCPQPSASNCDDIFVVQLPQLQQSFDYDGYHYTVSLSDAGGFLKFLSNAQCAAAGVANGCYGLQTIENATTPINFVFNIKATQIPEPASLALFAVALFGLGATLRRKSS